MTRSAETPVTKLLTNSGLASRFSEEPNATSYIYDTLALAYLVDPTYATDVEEMWVDVDITWGPSYGRTLGYEERAAGGFSRRPRWSGASTTSGSSSSMST